MKLHQRIKNKEIVLYQTDKSDRWSIDTPENYKEACLQHLTEVKPLADSVDESLNVSTDCGSSHRDGKTPILDVKVWIEEVQPNVW